MSPSRKDASRVGEIRARDGCRLYRRRWDPDCEPRAALQLVHGLGEHSGRYEHVGARLADEGIRVAAADLRGHGNSGGKRGHGSMERLREDLDVLLERLESECGRLPRFLYGHSLGGLLVLSRALRGGDRVDGIVAASPALQPGFEPPAWKVCLGRLLARIWPTLTLGNEVDPEALSRDPEVQRRYLADPLVHDRISARLGTDLLDEGDWALAHAGELSVPALLLHGDSDELTSPEASRRFVEAAGPVAALRRWPGLAHELHNEPEGTEVVDEIITWVRRIARSRER